MPLAPHLGMGHRSISSPTLSNAVNSTSATASTALAPTASSTSPVASDDPSPAPTPPASTSSRSGFLSRILPLRGRNRNVADFHIRPDEPYKKYSAGEHVHGSVVLVVVKPVRITHLVVSLHGYVRVRKDPSSTAKAQGASTLPQGGGSARPRYHGNGFASLFQDEQVLSGEGRLEPGKYEFGFDLVFPVKGLPSSIDFERGTISYNVTATLTRPTSIAATSSCDRKVMLVDKVDIGLLPPPRPRTIFLEPISKRTRRKKSMGLDKVTIAAVEVNDPPSSEADSAEPPNSTDERDHANDARSPIQSDMHSEVSEESGLSASTGVSRTELALSQVGTLSQSAKQQVVDDKTITATIELLRGGCIPGDTVSVRVTVQHIKRVKSMTGVIVTLYRQGKVDCAPSPSLFTDAMVDNNGLRVEKEEVYPRSRTGLGGLSLSSSGSTSVFRKDLDQNMAPLIIDPATMQTSVTVPVKMPDDSFPTIKGVPGEMISFKYLVEVVVDLGGRLANQFQGGQTSRFGSFGHGTWDASSNTYGPRRGANMADTTQLRREKGVISVSMETVVGTVDTSRGRRRSKASPSSRRYQMTDSDDEESIRPDLGYVEEVPYDPYMMTNGHISANGYFPSQPNGNRYLPPAPIPQPYPPPPLPSHHSHTLQLSHPSQPRGSSDLSQPPRPDYSEVDGHTREAAPLYIPPPEIQDQNQLSEKERVRQAETRLLPSQPPAGPSSGNDDDNIYDAEDTPQIPCLQVGSPDDDAGEGPSAPTQDDLSVVTATPGDPQEDKLEVERRRLLNEASAPPEFPEDAEQRNGGPSARETPPDAEPSAPVLDDADDFPGYGSRSGSGPSRSPNHGGGEQLPAYQR